MIKKHDIYILECFGMLSVEKITEHLKGIKGV